jgi:dinuclear metal center YbgI/SA1388 family protein
LTVTPEVVAEAVQLKSNLIVTHHPVLFRPVQRINGDTTEGRMLLTLLKAGIAVFSSHTAFDDCPGGINDEFARRLELQNVGYLRPVEAHNQYKLVVFVPEQDLRRVSDAIFAAGAGQIGNYSECSFRVTGTGSFFGGDTTNPTIGQKGKREEVSEWRLEAICPEPAIAAVVAAMRKAHSYEEPAFDIVPLRSVPGAFGAGRVGQFPAPLSLRKLAERLRNALACGLVQFVGEPNRQVEKVALACGAAGELLTNAMLAKADAFVTGEMRFHELLIAKANQLALVLPGHYATERFGIEVLTDIIRKSFPRLAIDSSKAERDPLDWA